MLVAKVVIEQTAYSFDKPYGYIVPSNLIGQAQCGCRVLVPFGKGNQYRQGMILTIEETNDASNLKLIYSIIDSVPILNEELLLMCEWMHNNLFCTYFDAIKSCLPVGITFKVDELYSKGKIPFETNSCELNDFFSNNNVVSLDKLLDAFDFLNDKKISQMVSKGSLIKIGCPVRKNNDATLKFVRPKIDRNELNETTLSDKQRNVAEFIFDIGCICIKEVIYYTGVTVSVINTLEKKGIIEIFQKQVYRTPNYDAYYSENCEIILTDEQNNVFEQLSQLHSSNTSNVSLLYGITGSGKTSVFLKLVEKSVKEGKGAIVMVPEISLTPQTIARFGRLFGNKIAVFHSAMSIGQRMDEFKRVKNGEALVAIGTRSAIFAPVKNLSLIIIDEEQEHTYKSEKSPRFHARDLAKFRVSYNKALLVLASATPSIETYSLAMSGKYSMHKLSHRYGDAVLPDVKTVDMRKELTTGNSSVLSNDLKYAINDALIAKKQAIILLNRRGHNTYISCPTCGYVATCPNCSVSLTYHSANGRILCHYCGYSESSSVNCPSCSDSKLRFMGIGTQRVEEELKVAFPDAKILRLDADSTSARDSFSEYLDLFSKGDYDIMLGTQMVAKGLDFPNVTVVGVLGADSATNSNDYRSFERSFSLLTQVLGRAGRGNEKGIAIIQTVEPDSNLIKLAAAQDYDSFYNEEIRTRKMMIYPPYCDIAVIATSSSYREYAEKCINKLFDNIKNLVSSEYSDIKLIILGPSVAIMPKLNSKYRYRMIIKTKNNKRFREMLQLALTNIKKERDTSVYVDINPETII